MSRKTVLEDFLPKKVIVRPMAAGKPAQNATERSTSGAGLEASNQPAPERSSGSSEAVVLKETTTAEKESSGSSKEQTDHPELEASNTPSGEISAAPTQEVVSSRLSEKAAEAAIRSEPAALATQLPAQPPASSRDQLRNRAGPVKAMDRVMGLYATGDTEGEFVVSEIEPDLIDRSFIGDRIEDPNDHSISDLVVSIRENGQQVPILVRVHPNETGRYQTAYGHRRVTAAKVLGKPVRAIVRALTDAQLVVAQGQENLERRDLSYIERAFFAMRLKERDFSHPVIAAAMGVYKSDVSNFIKVAREVPEVVIRAIGPAPKAGGPRWRLLAERLKAVPAEARAAELFKGSGFSKKSTDERFVALLEALAPSTDASTRTQEVFKDLVGRRVGRFEETDDRFIVSIDRRVEPDFGAYLRNRLPDLLAAYRRDRESPDPQREEKGDEATE